MSIDWFRAIPGWSIKKRDADKDKNDHQDNIFLDLALYSCSNFCLRRNLDFTITRLVFYIFICLIELSLFWHHHIFCYIACLILSFLLLLSAIFLDILKYHNIIKLLIFSWDRFGGICFIDHDYFAWNYLTWVAVWSLHNIIFFSKR